MKSAAGAAALLLGVVVLSLYTSMSRETREPGVPASFLRSGAVLVQLGQGFGCEDEIRQFDGAPALRSVIGLTGLPLSAACDEQAAALNAIPSGARVDLRVQDGVVEGFFLSWMPAPQRVSLGVLLHPDRMSRADWLYLPGIGPALAERIVRDRHKNGEFGTLESLERVPGIGQGQIARWRSYFLCGLSGQ